MEEEDLIYAEEVRALVRGLAMERKVVFGGNFHFRLLLVLPADTAVSSILDYDTRFRKLLAYLIAALEVAALLGLDTLFHQSFDLCDGHSLLTRAKTQFAEFFVVIIDEDGEDLINFLHRGQDARGILLQKFVLIHAGVHVAHQIKNGGEGLRGI